MAMRLVLNKLCKKWFISIVITNLPLIINLNVFVMGAIILTVVASCLVLMFILFLMTPKLMVKESPSPFSFDETIERLRAAVEERGWKIPHMHDLQETLNKHGFIVPRTTVIEVCKPPIAYSMLKNDHARSMSAFMPCRISVYENSDHKVLISRMNGVNVSSMFLGVIRKSMKQAAVESEEIIFAAIGHQSLS